MTDRIPKEMTDVTPECWRGLGAYLHGDDVRLLLPESRRKFMASWEEITRQEENLDDAILIGLVGGTGVGKSTFINALAGHEVSRSSDRRPTTDRVIVYRHVRTSLPVDVPTDDFAQPEVLHDHASLEKVVLFDFPDFDSAEKSHAHIIRRYLPFLDVLFVVVDDVKYADRRLYELLSKLDHDSRNIFVLFNKTDRLEARYGERTQAVIGDLLADLDAKFRDHAKLSLPDTQRFAIAARPVYEARLRHQDTSAMAAFARVEAMLASFQEEKHRRAAKERNIDARKRDLAEALSTSALGPENRALLEEATSLVRGWRGELEAALASIPVEILSDSERHGVRGARLRQIGPRWGIPFSLCFTLIGEFSRRRSQQLEPSELGPRVMAHYRGYFEAIQNLRSRFASEFSGAAIDLTALPTHQADVPRLVPSDLGEDLRDAVQQRRADVLTRHRWLAHLPGLLTLALAVWAKVHPILEAAIGQRESSVLWTTLKSLFSALSPSFLVGTVLAVLLVYALTAVIIWLREIQKVEHAVIDGERRTRERVRQVGEQAVDSMDDNVRQLYGEFQQLDRVFKS